MFQRRVIFGLLILFTLLSLLWLNVSKVSSLPKELVPPPISNVLPPKIDHFVLIVLENKSFSQIIDNPDAPYINSLAKNGGVVASYYAVAHPSLPNYLALLGGDTFGVSSDCDDCFINKPSLPDNLEKAGYKWKAYMESMPNPCFLGNSGEYAQKHNPFIYFDSVRNNPTRCVNIVPYTDLMTDLSSSSLTPNFIWISPNLCNDMHDCSIAVGDKWLSDNVPAILTSPAFTQQNSILLITWDEDDSNSDNHIPLIFVSPKVKIGVVANQNYSHYSLLRTVENAWGLPALTQNDANAPAFSLSAK